MEKSYTSGPWQIQITGGEVETVTAEEVGLCADISGPDYETRNANARLIASAPDLLAALDDICSTIGEPAIQLFGLRNSIAAGRAAIDKARGAK